MQLALFLLSLPFVSSFVVVPPTTSTTSRPPSFSSLCATDNNSNDNKKPSGSQQEAATPAPAEAVATLVDDDEWNGVTMELTSAVSKTVISSLRRHAKDFLGGKEEYHVGDITREIDTRMKNAVANLRGKENYEIGDLVAYVTEKSIAVAEQKTGAKLDKYKEISDSIDKQVKTTVASYVGEENYKSGALAKAVATKVKTRVADFADVSSLSSPPSIHCC